MPSKVHKVGMDIHPLALWVSPTARRFLFYYSSTGRVRKQRPVACVRAHGRVHATHKPRRVSLRQAQGKTLRASDLMRRCAAARCAPNKRRPARYAPATQAERSRGLFRASPLASLRAGLTGLCAYPITPCFSPNFARGTVYTQMQFVPGAALAVAMLPDFRLPHRFSDRCCPRPHESALAPSSAM